MGACSGGHRRETLTIRPGGPAFGDQVRNELLARSRAIGERWRGTASAGPLMIPLSAVLGWGQRFLRSRFHERYPQSLNADEAPVSCVSEPV